MSFENKRLSIYFPSVSNPELLGSKSFLGKESTMPRHPFVLTSAFTYKNVSNVRVKFGIEDDVTIFADSGGYQLASGTANENTFNNKTALSWCESNADIFPILDRPINKDFSNFNYSLEKTAEAAKYYYENRSSSDKIILNVMSSPYSFDFKGVDEWYDQVIKPYPFEGICHGGGGRSIKHSLMIFFYLLNKGEFNKSNTVYYHFFGVSSNRCILYFAVLQKLLNESDVDVQLLFDSSSPFIKAYRFGQMSQTATVKGNRNFRLSKRNKKRYEDTKKLPCRCPVCSDSNICDLSFNATVAIHNLNQLLDWKDLCETLILEEEPEVAKFFKEETSFFHNVNVIRSCLKNPCKAVEIIRSKFGFNSDDEIDDDFSEVQYDLAA